MKLERISDECQELYEDIKERTKENTVDYMGRPYDFETNKNRAAIGILAGLVVAPIIPIVGLPVLAYGGVKAYQAYKDKKKERRENGRK